MVLYFRYSTSSTFAAEIRGPMRFPILPTYLPVFLSSILLLDQCLAGCGSPQATRAVVADLGVFLLGCNELGNIEAMQRL